MALTDNEIAEILLASAHSTQPIPDKTLRRFAAAIGHNPDAMVVTHEDFKRVTDTLKKNEGKPLPTVIARS